jgi:WhiB family redox-sensing transcriptional regulator
VTDTYREVYPLHGAVAPIAGGFATGGFDASGASFGFDVEEELRWQENALCAQTDPEAFFPEKGGSTREAKRICTTCAVRSECLEYALGNDERFGIWGGLSERERRRLKRKVS